MVLCIFGVIMFTHSHTQSHFWLMDLALQYWNRSHDSNLIPLSSYHCHTHKQTNFQSFDFVQNVIQICELCMNAIYNISSLKCCIWPSSCFRIIVFTHTGIILKLHFSNSGRPKMWRFIKILRPNFCQLQIFLCASYTAK